MNDVILTGIIKWFPLLNGGLLVTLIVAFLKNRFEHRKLTVEENAGLRKEFIDEMHALREQVSGLRDDNEALRGEVKLLRRENDALRDEVRGLHGVIDGLRRQSLEGALSTQRAVVDSLPRNMVPPATQAALDRIRGTGE